MMKTKKLVVFALVLLVLVWITPASTATAQGYVPPQFWNARQQVVRSVGGYVWQQREGEWILRSFTAVKTEIEQAGGREVRQSCVGGSSPMEIWHYFVFWAYNSPGIGLFSAPLVPMLEILRRHDPTTWGSMTS